MVVWNCMEAAFRQVREQRQPRPLFAAYRRPQEIQPPSAFPKGYVRSRLVQQPPPLTQEPIMLSRCGLCQRRFATCGQP